MAKEEEERRKQEEEQQRELEKEKREHEEKEKAAEQKSKRNCESQTGFATDSGWWNVDLSRCSDCMHSLKEHLIFGESTLWGNKTLKTLGWYFHHGVH